MSQRYDRHYLYELSVQNVEAEIDFVDDTYRKLRGRRAKILREDFCGTANSSCEWVRRRPGNSAYGVDLSGEVLEWGRENKVPSLSPSQQERIHLVHGDVRTAKTPRADITLAMNFSYWLFLERKDLLRYFRAARQHLAPGGIFVLDFYGGSDACKEMRERRQITGPRGLRFTYVWDQARFEPIHARLECHIHFSFPDRSRIARAFTYHWRLWTLPEVRELLAEAGFRGSTVYWEQTDEKTGEGNGEYLPSDEGEADPAWIVYLVAER